MVRIAQLVAICLILSCKENPPPQEPAPVDLVDSNPIMVIGDIQVETLATGFNIPWGIAIIGEEEFFFTDRTGEFYHYLDGTTTAVDNIPFSNTFTTPAGLVMAGLMDVSLHPEYSENGWIYVAHVTFDNRLTVSRFQLAGDAAINTEIIFKATGMSVGSRICWQDNRHFFLSVGVGGDPYPIPGPQNLQDDRGKIHRLLDDGEIPDDNPVFEGFAGATSIWSYGHRNPQGMYYDTTLQVLYANEHGPFGGDELNIIEKGGNYGWPLFSHGLNYDGSPVSSLREAGAETFSILPLKHWDQIVRVSPSGLLKVSDSRFLTWNGSFLMGSLYPQNLLRYDPQTDQTEILLAQIGRVREVAQLPSGNLIILVDSRSPGSTDRGRILKLSPTVN